MQMVGQTLLSARFFNTPFCRWHTDYWERRKSDVTGRDSVTKGPQMSADQFCIKRNRPDRPLIGAALRQVPACRTENYFRCLETSLVISNIET